MKKKNSLSAIFTIKNKFNTDLWVPGMWIVFNIYFFRYNAKLTVLDEPKKVNVENFKILYPELKTLLLTKTNDANNDSSGFKFMEQLSPSIEIKTPLSGWNSETICTFTRSLCLPYV